MKVLIRLVERITEQGNDKTQPDKGDNGVTSGPLTGTLEKINWNSATFTGRLAVPSADIPFSQVTVCYSDAEKSWSLDLTSFFLFSIYEIIYGRLLRSYR